MKISKSNQNTVYILDSMVILSMIILKITGELYPESNGYMLWLMVGCCFLSSMIYKHYQQRKPKGLLYYRLSFVAYLGVILFAQKIFSWGICPWNTPTPSLAFISILFQILFAIIFYGCVELIIKPLCEYVSSIYCGIRDITTLP